jgi:hypothetical protein
MKQMQGRRSLGTRKSRGELWVPSWYMCSGTDERSSWVAFQNIRFKIPSVSSVVLVSLPAHHLVTPLQLHRTKWAPGQKFSSLNSIWPSVTSFYTFLSIATDRQTVRFNGNWKWLGPRFNFLRSAHAVWLSGSRYTANTCGTNSNLSLSGCQYLVSILWHDA